MRLLRVSPLSLPRRPAFVSPAPAPHVRPTCSLPACPTPLPPRIPVLKRDSSRIAMPSTSLGTWPLRTCMPNHAPGPPGHGRSQEESGKGSSAKAWSLQREARRSAPSSSTRAQLGGENSERRSLITEQILAQPQNTGAMQGFRQTGEEPVDARQSQRGENSERIFGQPEATGPLQGLRETGEMPVYAEQPQSREMKVGSRQPQSTGEMPVDAKQSQTGEVPVGARPPQTGELPVGARQPQSAGEMPVDPFARVDTDRQARTGFPEVVWSPGKTAEQIARILEAMVLRQPVAMATRVEPCVHEQVALLLPGVQYHATARILTYKPATEESSGTFKHPTGTANGSTENVNGATDTGKDIPDGSATGAQLGSAAPSALSSWRQSFGQASSPESGIAVSIRGLLAIVSAGTSDLPVAEEARVTAEVMGMSTRLIVDVGVAGLHRLLNQIDVIREADVVIVVAGMDGALPSVVAGLVEAPIIAVPTSIGYGASFGGVAALLTMLNSCAPGLTVVNIDNGFGAALAAGRVLRSLSHVKSTAQT